MKRGEKWNADIFSFPFEKISFPLVELIRHLEAFCVFSPCSQLLEDMR